MRKQRKGSPRRENLLLVADCAAILLACAVLIGPLWRIEYLRNWGSIDSTFIADARFLREHWPHPLWMPFWYCGTRFDYVYPPALRYGTALLSIAGGISTARAYHLYTAFFYSLGGVGVYLLLRAAGSSRFWGWTAAAAWSLVSPSFLFLRSFRDDSLLHMPQRLNVLVKWGEGPHVSALALLPFALAFSWRAVRGGGGRWMALASAACALVVSHNFYGATALAIFFPLLAWSLAVTHSDRRMAVRAAAIAALAYALTAFWLTPSYVLLTLANLKLVARPATSWARWAALGIAVLFVLASARLARGRQDRAWRLFVCGAALALFLLVGAGAWFDARALGEPHRLVPELDLALILLGIEALRGRRILAAAVLTAALVTALPYLTHAWSVFEADPRWQDRIEYRLTDWIAQHLPHARVFATGSLRLWYNAWRDGEQVGGGSEQGLLNDKLSAAQWQVSQDATAGRDILWLQALGADAVAVHRPPSQEEFHEFAVPTKFEGRLPVLYDEHQGDAIYAVPRRFPAHARIVAAGAFDALRPIPVSEYDRQQLAAYVAAIENGPDRPVDMEWPSPDAIRLRARLQPGEALVVQETYDPSWRATEGTRIIPIRKDPAGLMHLDAPPGDHDIRLQFELPQENIAGRVLSIAALLTSILLGTKKTTQRNTDSRR